MTGLTDHMLQWHMQLVDLGILIRLNDFIRHTKLEKDNVCMVKI